MINVTVTVVYIHVNDDFSDSEQIYAKMAELWPFNEIQVLYIYICSFLCIMTKIVTGTKFKMASAEILDFVKRP